MSKERFMKGKRQVNRFSRWLLALLCAIVLAGCGATPQGADALGTDPQTREETGGVEAGNAREETDPQPGGEETQDSSEGEADSQPGGEETQEQKGAGGKTDSQPGGEDDGETDPGQTSSLAEDGVYTTREDVAEFIHIYGHLPSNFITKKEAEKLGWQGGSLEPFAPGMCIGGNRFGNYEGILPEKEGRFYTECDIDTLGADKRGAKRIVFSNDGLIYYTEDHYESFELLYGEE